MSRKFASILLAVFMVVMMTGSALAATVSDEQSLKDAFAQGGEVVLANSITLTDTATIPADKTVTLNLNCYTISQSKECTDSYSMIANDGILTITGNGKLSFTDTGAGEPNASWASYTIRNAGTLVVENGTIEHLGTQPYNANNAIFHYSGSTTIKDGTISAPYSRSLRVWQGTATIDDGTFDGQVWVQPVNNTSVSLTINNGSFRPGTRSGDGSSVFVTNDTRNPSLTVTGGIFETKIGCADANKLVGCITGGSFTESAKDNTNALLFNTEVCEFKGPTNGYYEFVRKPLVASIGINEYYSIQDAVDAVTSSATIKVIESHELTETVTIPKGKKITLDLNEKIITGTDRKTSNFELFANKGELIITGNGIITLEATDDRGWNAYSAVIANLGGKLTIQNGTLQHLGGTDMAYVIDNNSTLGYTSAVIHDGTLVSTYRVIRHFTNHAKEGNDVTIYGGNLTGKVAVWVQLPSGKANAPRSATLNITGGTLTSTGDSSDRVIYSYTDGESFDNTTINIEGGTFNGNLYVGGCKSANISKVDAEDINITGGVFNGEIYNYCAENGGTHETEVSGGIFAKEVYEGYIAEGYGCVPIKHNGQLYYTVAKLHTVTFNVHPADAMVVVTDSNGDEVIAEAPNTYRLMNGDYSYIVSCDGYISNTTDFTVEGSDKKITVSLKLSIDAATPVIKSAQMASASYTQGMTAAALSVEAEIADDGVLSYQWYENTTNTTSGGTAIASAKDKAYTPNTDTIGTKYYYCVVTNTNNDATNEKTASVTSSVATITVTEKEAGKHTAEITVNGQDGATYTDVKAVLKKLGDAGEGTPKELTMSSSNGKQVYLYQEVLEDGDYNLVITAKTMVDNEEKEVTLTELIHLLDADDKHTTTLPEATKSSVVDDDSGLGIIAGNVEDIAANLDVEYRGGHLEVVLTTKDDEYDEPEDEQKVEERAEEDGVEIEMVLDIDLTVTQYNADETKSNSYDLGDDNTQMLKIMIPIDLDGRDPDSFVMYRVHNGKLEVLPRGTGTESYEHFTVGENNITIYAKLFSSYVIAYGVPAGITYPDQDETVTAFVGQTATMEVVADNVGSYQWQVNRNDGKGWVNCQNGTQASYTTSATKLENNGYQYRCQLTSKSGVVSLSCIFTLEVLEQPTLPKTGDNSSLLLWGALLAMTGAAFCLMMKKCRA